MQNTKQILISVGYIYEREGLDDFILLWETDIISGEIFLLLWKVSFNIFMIQEVCWWNRILVQNRFFFFSNLDSQTHIFFPFSVPWLTPFNFLCTCLFLLLNYRFSLKGLFIFTFASA